MSKMKRALVLVALVLGCHFAAVMVTGLSYLVFGPPGHFSRVTEDPVYWAAFGTLLGITGYWRRKRKWFPKRTPPWVQQPPGQ
jgi:hypothetical protein